MILHLIGNFFVVGGDSHEYAGRNAVDIFNNAVFVQNTAVFLELEEIVKLFNAFSAGFGNNAVSADNVGD